jgi:hypothetical protein
MTRTIEWRHLWREGGGIEHTVLESSRAVGRIECHAGADPFELEYEVRWDPRWNARFLSYRLRARGVTHYRSVSADGAGHWAIDGLPDRRLYGGLDVDLWPTPFTNTMAIRRILGARQTAATLRAAWLDPFAGTVSAREQRYARLAPGLWRFESLDDGFSAELSVDDDGFVLDYPGLFVRA